MFGMIPFTREENSLWNYLDNMEKSLFTGFGDMSQFPVRHSGQRRPLPAGGGTARLPERGHQP